MMHVGSTPNIINKVINESNPTRKGVSHESLKDIKKMIK